MIILNGKVKSWSHVVFIFICILFLTKQWKCKPMLAKAWGVDGRVWKGVGCRPWRTIGRMLRMELSCLLTLVLTQVYTLSCILPNAYRCTRSNAAITGYLWNVHRSKQPYTVSPFCSYSMCAVVTIGGERVKNNGVYLYHFVQLCVKWQSSPSNKLKMDSKNDWQRKEEHKFSSSCLT